jgi:putative transcriptional regulator
MLQRIAIVGALAAIVLLARLPHHESKSPFALSRNDEVPSVGRFLVATEKLGDPNFRESVILVLRHDEEKGTLGLVINRRSKVSLARIFPDITGAKSDPVYVGGPVELSTVQALLRTPTKSGDRVHILSDVYSTSNKDEIEKAISSGTEPSKFHVYMGYAGWASGQLEAEMELGAWTVVKASPDQVFDEDPDSLWSRLIRKADSQIALNTHPNRGMIPSSH